MLNFIVVKVYMHVYLSASNAHSIIGNALLKFLAICPYFSLKVNCVFSILFHFFLAAVAILDVGSYVKVIWVGSYKKLLGTFSIF